MTRVNDRYFEFHEMQLDIPDLALFVHYGISEFTYYMSRNIGLSTPIAIVSYS